MRLQRKVFGSAPWLFCFWADPCTQHVSCFDSIRKLLATWRAHFLSTNNNFHGPCLVTKAPIDTRLIGLFHNFWAGIFLAPAVPICAPRFSHLFLGGVRTLGPDTGCAHFGAHLSATFSPLIRSRYKETRFSRLYATFVRCSDLRSCLRAMRFVEIDRAPTARSHVHSIRDKRAVGGYKPALYRFRFAPCHSLVHGRDREGISPVLLDRFSKHYIRVITTRSSGHVVVPSAPQIFRNANIFPVARKARNQIDDDHGRNYDAHCYKRQ